MALPFIFLLPVTLTAQPAEKRSLQAVRVDRAPVLDGRVLDDPVWQSITPGGEFTQTTLDAGRPASQRTEVRVVYTDEAMYFSFVCFDDDPGTIVVSDARRDVSLAETDSVQFILDTYRDGQNGFVFGTNPAGRQFDGQLDRAGDENGFNKNWDGVWDVRTDLGD